MAKNSGFEFEFDIEIDPKQLVPPANHLSIGVYKQAVIYQSDYKKPLTSVASGMKANEMNRSEQFKDEKGQTQTTTNIFRAIWQQGDLVNIFYEFMNKKADDLVNAWFIADDDVAYKKAQNSVLAILRQSYRALANRNTVGEKRAAQKGFSDKYIGTGQTYKALGARIIGSSSSEV